MSTDKLAHALQGVRDWAPKQEEDPDKRMIEAMEKALATTTPERPGCPWDSQEEDNERRNTGIWLTEGH